MSIYISIFIIILAKANTLCCAKYVLLVQVTHRIKKNCSTHNRILTSLEIRTLILIHVHPNIIVIYAVSAHAICAVIDICAYSHEHMSANPHDYLQYGRPASCDVWCTYVQSQSNPQKTLAIGRLQFAMTRSCSVTDKTLFLRAHNHTHSHMRRRAVTLVSASETAHSKLEAREYMCRVCFYEIV